MKIKISQKIAGLSTIVAIIPVLLISILIIIQEKSLQSTLSNEIDTLIKENTSQIVRDVYDMCKATDVMINNDVNRDISMVESTLSSKAFNLTSVKRNVNVKNIYNGSFLQMQIPDMKIGNKNATDEIGLLDRIATINSGTDKIISIYQRDFATGSMVCIISTGKSENFMGTYIPAIGADNEANFIAQNILNNKEFTGIQQFKNNFYKTVAKPIFDSKGQIIGMLMVNVNNKSIKNYLAETIHDISVGKTGYVYVLSAKEDEKGTYIISKDGKKDGVNIYEAQDADGNFTVKTFISLGIQLEAKEVAYSKYQWKNEGETNSRTKLAALSYYKPWKWVIGAGVYEDDYQETKSKVNNSLKNLLYRTIISGIILIIIAIIVSYIVGKKIANPILKMVDFAKSISIGNLQQDFHISRKDEIGELSASLKNMQESLSSIIMGIKSNSDILIDFSKELTDFSSELSQDSDNMNIQSNQVVSATEQTSQNVNTIAATAEEMNMNISMVASATEQMTRNMNVVSDTIKEITLSMDNISKNSKKASETANNASNMSKAATDSMKNLGESASEIGEVTHVIKKIAEKTNLLALNATIEAASAGEAGKGFAVVATEIKELARQSAQAAEDIAKKIEGVQVNTKEAIEVISEVSVVIEEINESEKYINKSVEEQTNAMNNISINISEADKGVQNIAGSVQELTIGSADLSKNSAEAALATGNVAENILSVSQDIAKNLKKSRQMNESANNLSDIAEKLRELIKKFEI